MQRKIAQVVFVAMIGLRLRVECRGRDCEVDWIGGANETK